MANYLMKFKGKYRLKAPYDLCTNQFTREVDGSYADNDVYIECRYGMIYHVKGQTIEAWIGNETKPYQRHKVQTLLKECSPYIIKGSILEGDTECTFQFNVKDIDRIANILLAKTRGASISPFSGKNLPKDSYEIPEKDMKAYTKLSKQIIEKYNISMINKIYKEIILVKDPSMGYREQIHKEGKWNTLLTFMGDKLKN